MLKLLWKTRHFLRTCHFVLTCNSCQGSSSPICKTHQIFLPILYTFCFKVWWIYRLVDDLQWILSKTTFIYSPNANFVRSENFKITNLEMPKGSNKIPVFRILPPQLTYGLRCSQTREVPSTQRLLHLSVPEERTTTSDHWNLPQEWVHHGWKRLWQICQMHRHWWCKNVIK